MSGSYDLRLLDLSVRTGQHTTKIPGLYIAQKPRHATRGRGNDQFILYLTMHGKAILPSERQEQILERLAQNYYKTPGSVTAALRVIARTLNQYLLDHNLKAGGEKASTYAILSQFVIRNDRLYIAHSGPAHAHLLSAKTIKDISDAQFSGQGLGLSRTTPIYYQQVELTTEDILIVSPKLPSTWNDALCRNLLGQSPDRIFQLLSALDFQGVLIQIQKGIGNITVLQPKGEQAPSGIAPTITPVVVTDQVPVFMESDAIKPTIQLESTSPTSIKQPSYAKNVSEIPHPKRAKKTYSLGAAKFGLSFLQTVERAMDRTFVAASSLLNRLLPGEATTGLPPSVMIVVAVTIPLIVVVIASLIYFRSGLGNQFDTFYQLAQQAATQALSIDDPNLQRLAWQNVQTNLDQAELYRETSETNNLRLQVQQNLDDLDKIKRLDYQPILNTNLPEDSKIIKLATAGNELFLLEQTSGSIFRAIVTSNGYTLDGSFQCGPSAAGAGDLSNLIDFDIIPKASQLNASVHAMDAFGNRIICISEKEIALEKLTPPSTGMGNPSTFTIELNNLFVLDPQKNAVWIYWKNNLAEQPELFFTDEIPRLDDVISMAVSENDLYILHADGHLTICGYSNWGVAPTRCTDPANYLDSRNGYINQVYTPETPFSQVQTTQPPDPSLFLFEPQKWAIHHFSLRQLTYHRQYRPTMDFIDTFSTAIPTAFAINTENRILFIANGLQIYTAHLP